MLQTLLGQKKDEEMSDEQPPQQNSKTRQAAVQTRPIYNVPNFIDLFGDDWREIKKQIVKRNFYTCENIVLTQN